MSEEEKKAYDNLIMLKYFTQEKEDKKAIQIILDLVEKQSKEIEHWKAGMKIIEKDKNNHIKRLERKIKELDSQNEVLEEIKTSYEKKTDKLLKEKVKQQKEIEELKEDNKHQWEERCKLTFELENSISKDKIKAKMEEVQKRLEEETRTDFLIILKILENELQSLLEKE